MVVGGGDDGDDGDNDDDDDNFDNDDDMFFHYDVLGARMLLG